MALQVVGIGLDGKLWHTTRDVLGNWSGFGSVEVVAAGGPPSFTAIDCVGTESGLQVVGIGNDGRLWHTLRDVSGNWTGFGLVEAVAKGGPVRFIDLSCASIDTRTLQVVGVSSDGLLWQTTRRADLSWDNFVRLESLAAGGPSAFRRVSSVGTGSGLQVVGVGNDGKLWHTLRASTTGKWSGIGMIEAVLPQGPASFRDVSCSSADGGTLQVVGVGNDGKLWHALRDSAGTWTGMSDGWVSSASREYNGLWTANVPLLHTAPFVLNHTHEVDVYLFRPKSAGNTCNPVAYGTFLEHITVLF